MSELNPSDIANMDPYAWIDAPTEPVDDFDVMLWSGKTFSQQILDIAAEAERLIQYRNKYGADSAFVLGQWQIFHEFCNVFCTLPTTERGSRAEVRLAEWEMCSALGRPDDDKAFESIHDYWDRYLTKSNHVDF